MTLLVQNRALLDAFRDGEEWALRQVYREYAPKVARYARWNFEMSHVDVSETTQLTFMRVFNAKARSSYDGIRPFLNFVLRTAHNVAVNELEKAWRRHEHLPADIDDDWFDRISREQAKSAEDKVFDAERKKIVADLRKQLSPVEKDVFEKRFFDALSQDAAAAALGLTRQRVRTLEQRIRKKAFKLLKTSGHLPPGVSTAVIGAVVEMLLGGGMS